MNGNRYLLDTNVFIHAIQQQIKLPPAHYYYSIITELELLSFPHLSTADEIAIRNVLKQLTRADLDEQVKAATIRIRRSSQMKLPDSIISASAIVNEATLVTNDQKLAKTHGSSVISINDLLNPS